MEILREATPIARKEHRCDFCGDIISVGEKYNRPIFMTEVSTTG